MEKNKTNILIQSASDHHLAYYDLNLGAAALIKCTAETLRKAIPGAEIASLVQLSPEFAGRNNIRMIKGRLFSNKSFSLGETIRASLVFTGGALWAVLHKYLHMDAGFLVRAGVLKEYHDADIIIDIGADRFNDSGVGILPVFEHSRDILLGRIMGKPVVIYAQSPGPFRGRMACAIARFALNRASLITLREEISRDYMREIGVDKPPIHIVADPAFLLEPCSAQSIRVILSNSGIDDRRPLIGLSVTEGNLLGAPGWIGYRRALKLVYLAATYFLPEKICAWALERAEQTRTFRTIRAESNSEIAIPMARIADYMVQELGANVLVIPHAHTLDGKQDGRTVARKVVERVVYKENIVALLDKYTAEETKKIIGQCDMLVSLKMHPTIFALSQYVPVVAIGGHQKFRGIMRMLGQEEWVCDDLDAKTIKVKTTKLWQQREQVRQQLEKRIPFVKEQAMLNAKLVAELLSSSKFSKNKAHKPF